MKGLRYGCLIGCMGVALLATPAAYAVDGRITFSGEIVEPTCSIGTDNIAPLVSVADRGSSAVSHSQCGVEQANTDIRAGSRYDVAVFTLAPERQADQLLSYFTAYLRTTGVTAHLVTQTYE